jgi:hypothetical protein
LEQRAALILACWPSPIIRGGYSTLTTMPAWVQPRLIHLQLGARGCPVGCRVTTCASRVGECWSVAPQGQRLSARHRSGRHGTGPERQWSKKSWRATWRRSHMILCSHPLELLWHDRFRETDRTSSGWLGLATTPRLKLLHLETGLWRTAHQTIGIFSLRLREIFRIGLPSLFTGLLHLATDVTQFL